MTTLPAPTVPAHDAVTAPGSQGRLFPTHRSAAEVRFVVVAENGARTAPVGHLGAAAAQAHAAARAAGRAWVEGTDGRTVEIALCDDAVIVAPCEPGWPATIARLMAEQAVPRKETP